MRFRFAKWACDRLTEEADFSKKKINFSDETHAYSEKPIPPKRVTVWSRGIIVPFFFENEQGVAVTVSEDRYRKDCTFK